MSRLGRRNRTDKDLGILDEGGALDLFDNLIKSLYRINDAEYNYLCESMTDEELSLLVKPQWTYAEKRKVITVLESKLNQL